MQVYIFSLFLLLIAVFSVSAQEKANKPGFEPVYYDVVQKLMEFEFENSDVMETANMLTNIFGGLNWKTPAYRAAAEWARGRLTDLMKLPQ